MKREIDTKINPYLHWVDCGFEKFENKWFVEKNKLYIKRYYHIVWSAEKMQKIKTREWQRQLNEN